MSRFQKFRRAVALLPVWAITNAVKPLFPDGHPWKGKKMTLMSWVHCGTPASVAFGIGFWFVGATTAFSIWLLRTNHPDEMLLMATFSLAFEVWFLKKVRIFEKSLK